MNGIKVKQSETSRCVEKRECENKEETQEPRKDNSRFFLIGIALNWFEDDDSS